jgi:hypothetical protein
LIVTNIHFKIMKKMSKRKKETVIGSNYTINDLSCNK